MKKMRFVSISLTMGMLFVLAMALSGCIGGSSTPSKFYLLRSIEESQTNSPARADIKPVSVLIGPITLPAYLDRSQMVTLAAGHELVVEEFNRWGEPLKDSFYRVLIEDLSLLLGSAELYVYDRRGSVPTDFQVVIDVTRFDSVPGGESCLTVFWAVMGKDGGSTMIKQRKSVFRAPVSATGFPGVVDAQNQTLTAFSREIASAIRSLQPNILVH